MWRSKQTEKYAMLLEVYEDTRKQLRMAHEAWLSLFEKKRKQDCEIARLKAENERLKRGLVSVLTRAQGAPRGTEVGGIGAIALNTLYPKGDDEIATQENNG